jgi:transposase
MDYIMDFINGTARNQLFLFNECLDNIIENDNPVRVIDAYVESLNLRELGFNIPKLKTGKPPYRPQVLLKIYIYGYNERIRTTRLLENECKRNKEMIWLTEGLAPDFKTISDFRKNNRDGIKKVFKEFLNFCNKINLLCLEEVGIDGTKMRAQNNRNNVYKRSEIDIVQQRIKKKISEYLNLLDTEDDKEKEVLKLKTNSNVEKIVKKLKKINKHKDKVDGIKKLFDENEDLNIYFATDEDSRFQSDGGKVRAGYNSQIASDGKHNLIIACDVTNESNDEKQMSPMIDKVIDLKEDLGIHKKTKAVLDAGYFNESEIINNKDKEDIDLIVCDKKESEKSKKKNKENKNKVPSKGYEIEDFKYNKDEDVYICPECRQLKKTHKNPGTEKSGRKVFEYHCYDCEGCLKRDFCTKNKRGRSIKASVNVEEMNHFKDLMKNENNQIMIKKRKELVEHQFGTIKRTFGYTYFIQKGIKNVRSEFSFICFIYNFKRVLNILGVNRFIEEIKRQKLVII